MQCLQLQHLVEVIIVHVGVGGGVGGVAELQVGVVQVVAARWRRGGTRARKKKKNLPKTQKKFFFHFLTKKSKKKILTKNSKKNFLTKIFFDGPRPALLTVTGPIFPYPLLHYIIHL